jgi:hypothetical protein
MFSSKSQIPRPLASFFPVNSIVNGRNGENTWEDDGDRCDECVEMVRHDDERVQDKFALCAIVEDRSHEQFGCGSDLEETTALRRHGGDKVGPRFLWGKSHVGSITERPAAEALLIEGKVSGA